MWNKTRFTEKVKIKYPLVQGPFGGGLSTIKLTSTVSNSGGLGSFGSNNLKPEEIITHVHEIKKLTQNPFAINLWVSNVDKEAKDISTENYKKITDSYVEIFSRLDLKIPSQTKAVENFNEQVEALIEAKPPVFSFVFGLPDPDIIERCKRKNIITLGAATTLAEALAVEKAGVDCVVVSGMEAGGHRPSFLRASEDSLMGLNALLALASERISIPIVAAGGIVTAKQVWALLGLGAGAAQMGTAFLACEESGVNESYRNVLFSDRAQRTTLSRFYTGRLARFIENDFLKQLKETNKPFLPYPLQNHLMSEIKKHMLATGVVEHGPIYAGQGAGLLKHKKTRDLIDCLVFDLEKIINNK